MSFTSSFSAGLRHTYAGRSPIANFTPFSWANSGVVAVMKSPCQDAILFPFCRDGMFKLRNGVANGYLCNLFEVTIDKRTVYGKF